MISGYTLTIKRLCFLLASFVILTIQTVDSLDPALDVEKSVKQDTLTDNRETRNAEIDIPFEDNNLQRNKRYIPYEELQKRLRHFIGKRKIKEKRMRYFVGKKDDFSQKDADDFEKRMRYFVGKKSGLRYFEGKRNSGIEEPNVDVDVAKRMMRYFVGKRRYFLGKRRYFLGKRDDLEDDNTADSLEKRSRLRYFVGKRVSEGFTNSDEYKKRMRYFVGKREPSETQVDGLADKRMRYFVGKRGVNAPSDYEQYEKRMGDFIE